MASSYFTGSEAPQNFRVSSTESDGHYTKCLLCYTVKRNFYCPECIRAGNFVQSSMPYSDRYSEKQAKLLRLKANRKYILDRCEKLLHPKLRKDKMITEAKQSRDRLDLIRLAIEQRRSNIEEKQKQLNELKNHNNDLKQKLPRYQKRVSTLNKHVQNQSIELQNKVCSYNEQAEKLAALRRSRIRHLTKYIFPVYMTYDTSDSIEDMEFIGVGVETEEEEPTRRPRLHVVAPPVLAAGEGPAGAGLALAAQLLTLLAWLLDLRLPHTLSINEFSNWRVSPSGASSRARRVCAAAAALAASAGTAGTAPEDGDRGELGDRGPEGEEGPHPLEALHSLTIAAATDDPALGRVVAPTCGRRAAWCARWAAPPSSRDAAERDEAEPEHLSWPPDCEEAEAAPAPAPAASLVTSAAASLANMWRGWNN